MIRIPLTRGLSAVIDDQDAPLVLTSKWFACLNKGKTYAVSKRCGRNISLHALILGRRDGFLIDHKDGDSLNNRRSNLRFATQTQNMQNQKRHSDSSSPYKGIWKMKDCDRWAVQIRANGRRIYLGLFKSATSAALAYDAKALELFGPFARLNFPSPASIERTPATNATDTTAGEGSFFSEKNLGGSYEIRTVFQ